MKHWHFQMEMVSHMKNRIKHIYLNTWKFHYNNLSALAKCKRERENEMPKLIAFPEKKTQTYYHISFSQCNTTNIGSEAGL